MSFIALPFCRVCGMPFEYEVGGEALCGDCLYAMPAFSRARAVFRYDDASRRLVLRLKYHDQTALAATLGPWLATKDEIKDVNNLRLWLTVNGTKMQDGTTANFIFKIPFIVSYVSQFMTLLPGDVISTGTPAGVGLGMKPPVYLKDGDVVELGIDGLGTSKQHLVAYKKD